ncbi:MAG: LamG domain-containing protein [Deltaproteobacteria bacterium]|nr:LamG domain-containing protein [Deltaproteobacteria bacterium]
MNKYCMFLAGLLVVLFGSFAYCEAEEPNTTHSPRQAVAEQKQVSSIEALSTTVYPKEKTRHLLPHKRGDLLHIAFEKGYIGKGVKLEPVVLHETYTIEVLVKPSGRQIAYAAILGNHSAAGSEGFVVQQDGKDQGNFRMSFGDGEKFSKSDLFKLQDGSWHYLVVVGNNMNTQHIYVDGSLVGKFTPMNKLKNSSLPLQIGNWIMENRPFSGSIAEVRIANTSLSEKDIRMRWNKLKPQLEKM